MRSKKLIIFFILICSTSIACIYDGTRDEYGDIQDRPSKEVLGLRKNYEMDVLVASVIGKETENGLSSSNATDIIRRFIYNELLEPFEVEMLGKEFHAGYNDAHSDAKRNILLIGLYLRQDCPRIIKDLFMDGLMSEDPGILKFALQGIEDLDLVAESDLERVLELTGHPIVSVASTAVYILGLYTDDERARCRILEMLDDDKPRLVIVAVVAAGKMTVDDENIVSALMGKLEDDHIWIAIHACEALIQLNKNVDFAANRLVELRKPLKGKEDWQSEFLIKQIDDILEEMDT